MLKGLDQCVGASVLVFVPSISVRILSKQQRRAVLLFERRI